MSGRLLCFVRVAFTCIYLEFAELATTEACFREHAPDGALDKENWATLANDAWGLNFLTTDVSGEAGVNLRGFFCPSEDHLVSIDHHNEIAGVNMGGENWLVLTAEEARSLNSDLAKDFALSVDHIPLALDFVRFGGKRLHVLV